VCGARFVNSETLSEFHAEWSSKILKIVEYFRLGEAFSVSDIHEYMVLVENTIVFTYVHNDVSKLQTDLCNIM
jgi:hypothetical protein